MKARKYFPWPLIANIKIFKIPVIFIRCIMPNVTVNVWVIFIKLGANYSQVYLRSGKNCRNQPRTSSNPNVFDIGIYNFRADLKPDVVISDSAFDFKGFMLDNMYEILMKVCGSTLLNIMWFSAGYEWNPSPNLPFKLYQIYISQF